MAEKREGGSILAAKTFVHCKGFCFQGSVRGIDRKEVAHKVFAKINQKDLVLA
jgi:hypothetical protein